MISKLGFKILYLHIHVGHLAGITPYCWDKGTQQVRVSKTRKYAWYFSIGFSVFFVTLLWLSYYIYLQTSGFDLSDIRNIFYFYYSSVGADLLQVLWASNWRAKEFADIINQLTFFFSNVPRKFSIHSMERNYSSFVFGYILIFGLTMPSFVAIIYFIRCELHPLYDVLPIVCHNFEFLPLTIGIRFIFGMTIVHFGTTVVFNTAAIAYSFMFYWFYSLELSACLRKTPKSPGFDIMIYKCIEILKFRLNTMYGDHLVPGMLATWAAISVVSAAAVIKGQAGGWESLALGYLSIFMWSIFISFKISWMVESMFGELLARAKILARQGRAGVLLSKRIKTCTRIALNLGVMGYLDREMYILIGDVIVGQTINVILV